MANGLVMRMRSFSKVQLKLFQAKAKRLGMPLSIQHGPDNSLWCYKHELVNLKILKNGKN